MSKAKRGRPTTYRDEYPEKLIEHMAKGLSYESFAGTVGVCVDTLFEWERKHPEFSEAKKQGLALSRLFWEQVGRAGMTGKIPGFVPAVWIFNMKNRFGWRDRQDINTNLTVKESLNSMIVDAMEKDKDE